MNGVDWEKLQRESQAEALRLADIAVRKTSETVVRTNRLLRTVRWVALGVGLMAVGLAAAAAARL